MAAGAYIIHMGPRKILYTRDPVSVLGARVWESVENSSLPHTFFVMDGGVFKARTRHARMKLSKAPQEKLLDVVASTNSARPASPVYPEMPAYPAPPAYYAEPGGKLFRQYAEPGGQFLDHFSPQHIRCAHCAAAAAAAGPSRATSIPDVLDLPTPSNLARGSIAGFSLEHQERVNKGVITRLQDGDGRIAVTESNKKRPRDEPSGSASRRVLRPRRQLRSTACNQSSRYTALVTGRIRVLILKPGAGREPLRCVLAQEPDMTAQYDALSYTWGNSSKPYLIEVDMMYSAGNIDFIDFSTVAVTANLYSALRQLRSASHERRFWIDAICINQHDAEEREAQVLRMKNIFNRARQTVVWLGEEDETTEDATKAIGLLARYLEIPREAQQVFRIDLEKAEFLPWKLGEYHECYMSAPVWTAFERLLDRSWFSRVWVYQEIAVSHRIAVRCGSIPLCWTQLRKACTAVEMYQLGISCRGHQPLNTSVLVMHEAQGTYYDEILTVPGGAMAPVHKPRPKPREPRSSTNMKGHDATVDGATFLRPRLDIMLLLLRWAEATDPRDKVYALLGISSGISRTRIRPDYTLTVYETYTQTAEALSREPGLSALAFLSFVQHNNRRLTRDLPTWAPDWRRELHAPWLIYNSGFRTTRDVQPDFKFEGLESSRAFLAKGVLLMKISILSTQSGTRNGMPPPELLGRIPKPYHCSWAEAYEEGIQPRPDFRGVYRPSPRCACSESFWPWKCQWDNSDLDFSFLGRRPSAEALRYFAAEGLPSVMDDPDEIAWKEINGLGGITYGRRLFVTNLGFFGLGPLASKPGDEIITLLGGRIPYVIRRIPEHERVQFVGECYVFGIMDGEVLEGLQETDCEYFVFS